MQLSSLLSPSCGLLGWGGAPEADCQHRLGGLGTATRDSIFLLMNTYFLAAEQSFPLHADPLSSSGDPSSARMQISTLSGWLHRMGLLSLVPLAPPPPGRQVRWPRWPKALDPCWSTLLPRLVPTSRLLSISLPPTCAELSPQPSGHGFDHVTCVDPQSGAVAI